MVGRILGILICIIIHILIAVIIVIRVICVFITVLVAAIFLCDFLGGLPTNTVMPSVSSGVTDRKSSQIISFRAGKTKVLTLG